MHFHEMKPKRLQMLFFLLTFHYAMSLRIFGLTQCGEPKCNCFLNRGLINCSPGLGPAYSRVPSFTSREVGNVTELNLSGNDLTRINTADFSTHRWPKLKIVDLRLNPNLDCRSLENIPERIVVLSDCVVDEIGRRSVLDSTPDYMSPRYKGVPDDQPKENPILDLLKLNGKINMNPNDFPGPINFGNTVQRNSGLPHTQDSKKLIVSFKGVMKILFP